MLYAFAGIWYFLSIALYWGRIPDPGIKKAPDPGFRVRIRNTRHKILSNYYIVIRNVKMIFFLLFY
jgi:hypothetical protein